MKQHRAAEKDYERTIAQQIPDAGAPIIVVRAGASREFVVDLVGPDERQRQDRRNREQCDKEKTARLEMKYPTSPIVTAAATLPAELKV